MKLVKNIEKDLVKNNVSDKEAEEAFKKILKWIGEDPNREGLVETPKRLVKHLKNILVDMMLMLNLYYQKLLEMWKVTMIW